MPSSTVLKRAVVVDRPQFAHLISRMLAGRFDVLCVESGPQALAKLRGKRPALIVAELGPSGEGFRLAELLGMNVRAPHIPFILTCIKPPSDLVDRAKKAGIDAVLAKPFPPSALVERIGAALKALPSWSVGDDEKRDLVVAIRKRARGIDGLPTMSDAHDKIVGLVEDPGTTPEDIVEELGEDEGFLPTVVSLVGASHRGAQGKVASFKQALALAGPEGIGNLVMYLQVYRTLGAYQQDSKYDRTAFWKHSVGTGFIARVIAEHLKVDPSPCFRAGLLHDVGKVVLDRFYPRYLSQALAAVQETGLASTQVESTMLGVGHDQVGGTVAAIWNFSDIIVEAIACHHAPAAARRYPKISSVINVANAACNHLGYGSSGEAKRYDVMDSELTKSLVKLGVGPTALEGLVKLGKEQLEGANKFVSVLMGAGGEG